MRTQSIDTNPEVEKLLINMIRSMSNTERFNKTFSLTSSAIKLSKRAILRANPDKSKEELDLLFVEYHYGKDLAAKLKKFLKEKENDIVSR